MAAELPPSRIETYPGGYMIVRAGDKKCNLDPNGSPLDTAQFEPIVASAASQDKPRDVVARVMKGLFGEPMSVEIADSELEYVIHEERGSW